MVTLKDLKDEDFVQYKLPCMVISFPYCSFKCGAQYCQNYPLRNLPTHQIQEEYIAYRYFLNKLTKAIVFSGLEPFDSLDDMVKLIEAFRKLTKDPIIIYTGYNKEEITGRLELIKPYGNIIVKFGRYIPNRETVKNELLGVILASDNQYTEQIS